MAKNTDPDVETVVLDTLEKDQELKNLVINGGGKIETLMLSKFISLTDSSTGYTYPDMHVFDSTNKARTGGTENKSFADAVGSLTGYEIVKNKKLDVQEKCGECNQPYKISLNAKSIIMKCEECNIVVNTKPRYKWEWHVIEGLHHLFKQIIKMYATGLPWCILIHGSRYMFQLKSGVSDELVLSAIQRLVKLCTIFGGTVYMELKTAEEVYECIKTFFRGTVEKPRRWPIYNLFKKIEEDQVAMHCGITDFGIETSRAMYEKGYRPCDIGYDAKRVELGEMTKEEFLHFYGGSRKKDLPTKVPGMALGKAETLFNAYAPDKLKKLDDPNE